MNWLMELKELYRLLIEKPPTGEEVDAKIRKAVSDAWRKKIMEANR